MGSQKNFISAANYTIWCNITLTAAAIVACAPQIRTVFLKRFKQIKQEHDVAGEGIITTQDKNGLYTGPNGTWGSKELLPPPKTLPRVANGTQGRDRRSKHTPLMLSDKFLRGDGKVGVGDVRLTEWT
jgi:hypothetical protein